ncbi:MAG: ABC transporter substrate-binding protein [Anaerolineae bacterium]|jgi:peptide/nickel transport system substrate-binding protein
MKNLSKLTILLLVLVLLAACGPTEAPPEPTEPAAEQPTSAPEATEAPAPTEEPEPTEAAEPVILRYADKAADLGTLDPHFAAATNDRNVVDMIFNGLIRYKPGDGTVFEPDLATELPEPEMVDGKQVWTFNLRSGVMCHPSEAVPAYELTSEDVVWSLQKSANADTSAYAGEYTGMTVEAVDESTVQITLDTPLSEVLFFPKVADYAGGFIVCKQSYEALGAEEFKTNPVGTGPFMFESYSPQQNVMLVANEDYFRGRPQLDGVDYRYMPELNSRELGLQSGELDVINGAAEGIWVERMSQEEGILVDVYGVGEVATIHFNITVEPLDDPLVRKAIAYALDRDEFLALFGEPVSANVYSPVPAQFLAGGLTQEEVAELNLEYAVDRDMARDLLAEAGHADGFSLELVSSERESYLKNYQSMQAQLAEIGIDIEINVVDHSSMHELIREDVNPITIYVAWRPNADVYLTRFYHSDSIVVTGAKPDTNFSHYDQIDDMIEAARTELDSEAQIQMWKDAQIKLLEDMVTYPLQYQNQVTARHDYVDFGHELKSALALYAQITENTTINK